MTLLEQTSGTLVNVVTVLVGGGVGLLLRGRLPERITAVVMQGVGLTVVLIGLLNAQDLARVSEPPGIVVGLLALAVGGALGEWWRIEEGVAALGDGLRRRFRGEGRFTEGFVAASLLFCVGPLTLVGSLQNGLLGDDALLLLKATLDGLAALALATSYGVGVLPSAVVILVYQGGLSLGAGAVAGLVPDPATDPRVLLVNGVGGVIVLGLGITLLELRRLRVASLLPALGLVVAFYALARLAY